MTQTAWVLSLTQFYLGLGFMLFFLALELGLAWVLFVLRVQARRKSSALLAYRFWVRIYALALIVGFAVSLPLLLQLGTLWPLLMDRMGEVVGPLVALAVLTAFVFKSCFLGAMLYRQRTLSGAAHTTVVGMVAVGASLTAWWLMVLLAWMQRPVGTRSTENHFQITDWAMLLFDGVAPEMFGLLLAGGLMLVAALMLAVTAHRTRARPSDEGDRAVFAGATWLLLAAIVLQLALAAQLGRQLLPVQPARLAATLPQWQSGPPVRPALLAWLDVSASRSSWSLNGPALPQSFLPPPTESGPPATVSRQVLSGLDELIGLRPPVWITFASSRLALMLAGVLLLFAMWACWLARHLGFEPDSLSVTRRNLLRASLWLALAVQVAGWTHLLMGSLPYAVEGAVTFREIGAAQDTTTLWAVLLVQLMVYGALALGFRQLLGHTLRYGVVPVARHRGRA